MGSGTWIYQGRQYHQWFGHGTAPTTDEKPAPASLDDRIKLLGSAALASFPVGLRGHRVLQPEQAWQGDFRAAMHAWAGASGLSPHRFAETMLGTRADSPGAKDVQASAAAVATATRQREMWNASDHLAAGMQAVGLDHWPRFVAAAAARAAFLRQSDLLVRVQSQRGGPPGSGSRRGGPPVDTLSTAELARTARYDALVRQITAVEPNNPHALGLRQLNTAPSSELVASLEAEWLAVRGRQAPGPFVSSAALLPSPRLNPSGADRTQPGIAHTSSLLQAADRYWFQRCYKEEGAPVPAQVARALDGQRFPSFGALRRAFWIEVSKHEELLKAFTSEQASRMAIGLAPRASQAELTDRTRNSLEIDHTVRIADGGNVYDLSNMRVLTTRNHVNRHQGGNR